MIKRYDRVSVEFRLGKGRCLFPHQISITSWAGGGKTTLLNSLKGLLGPKYRFFSAGDFMRERADQIVRKMHLPDMREPDSKVNMAKFTTWLKTRPDIAIPLDKECDDRTVVFGREDFTVGEARVVHALMPRACKIFIDTDIRKRAQRRADQEKKPYALVLLEIDERDKNDKARLDAKFPGVVWDNYDFDLPLNNDEDDPKAGEKNAKAIVEFHNEWLKVNEHRLIQKPKITSNPSFWRAHTAA